MMMKVLQLEVELQTIERVVRRIEQANSGNIHQTSTGIIENIFAFKCCIASIRKFGTIDHLIVNVILQKIM